MLISCHLVKHGPVTGPSMLQPITQVGCMSYLSMLKLWSFKGTTKNVKKKLTPFNTLTPIPPLCLPSLWRVKDSMRGSTAGLPLTHPRIAHVVRCAQLNVLSILVRLIPYFPVRIQNFLHRRWTSWAWDKPPKSKGEEYTQRSDTRGVYALHYFLHTLI